MSTYGIEFTIGIPGAGDDVEDRIDAFYSSLAKEFPLVSIDMAWNDEKGSLTVLLGVQSPDGLDPQGLVTGVASDAIRRALQVSGLIKIEDEIRPAPSARVLEFA